VVEAPKMHTLKRSLEIDAPPNEVWRVLTTPELVREWAAAYVEGISIRTSWREGDPIAWKTPSGGTQACGTVAAFKPEKLLRFDYSEGVATEGRSFSDTFEIQPADHGTVLKVSTGPLDDAAFKALKGPSKEALKEIKSLAEESAQIHGVR
jgi:uncharacterized protein YndB with AHSA1/START domain